jgi:hypothetical protein
MFALNDLPFVSGPILAQVSPVNVVSAMSAVIMTSANHDVGQSRPASW